MSEFGTADFWYPKAEKTAGLGQLLDFAEGELDRPDACIGHHEALEADKPLGTFGDIQMKVLWPSEDHDYQASDLNNTSVVLSLCLGKWWVVLTGDAEEEVWESIADQIPAKTRFFEVPHHRSVNGTFGPDNSTPWLDKCPKPARLGISGDLSGSHAFPRPEVIAPFEGGNRKHFRTDRHHHVSFWTDGDKYDMCYTH